MSRHYRLYILLLVVVAAIALALFWWSGARAQAPGGYDCDIEVYAGGSFDAHCDPQVTATPPPTATATLTPVVVLPTWTATAVPSDTPTSTPVTPVTPVPAGALRLNVPLLDVAAGDPALDANNWAILWAGNISPHGGYSQARIIGARDGLRAYIQAMQPPVSGAAVTLRIGANSYVVRYPATAGWAIADRGDRGWSASRVIPWADLGGKPDEGDVWPLTFTAADGDAWTGALHWGLPDYAGRTADGAHVLSVQLSADASIGGGTDCGGDDDAAGYFPSWGGDNVGYYGSGTVSLGVIPYANVQNQWDTADWPCYSRYLARWPVSLPAGAQVVSATLNLYKFGHSGYAGEATGTNIMQVWEASPDWTETGVSWDNSPAALENVSRLPVGECAAAACQPGEWHAFDVTEIVKRAVQRGDADAAALLYTAAGQYHSGRYFYTREGSIKPVVRIAYILGEEPTAWPQPSATQTATSTATIQPTFTPAPSIGATATPGASGTPAPSPTTAAATGTPTPTVGASPTPLLPPSSTPTPTASSTPPPVSAAPRLVILGDSFLDEYRADNNRGGAYAATTFNLVELAQRLRGFALGPWGTWGAPRRSGYENNCALSGATSYTMVTGGQPQCAAAILRADKADYALIAIGANDFSPGFGTYQPIYSGTMTDAELDAKVRRVVQDVTAGVDAVLDAGADGVIVVSFTKWGLDPSIAARFPNAAGRRRVDDAIGRVNDGILALAAARGGRVAVVDQNAIGAERILPQLDSQGNLTVGGEKISFLVNGDEPHHVRLADGSHTGTVLSGILANWYLVEPLNERFGFNIAPLTDAEILSAAGIRPAGGTPTWTATAIYTPTTPVGATRTPTASITSTPSPTQPPKPSPTSTLTGYASPTPSLQPPTATSSPPSPTPHGQPPASCTRTVSPGGLAAAVGALKPGDVLCLNDGTYNEAIAPRTNGTQAAPITIRAVHDGKATIDGQGARRPVQLGSNNQAYGDWFVIEGLVLRNGTDAVLHVRADNNVFRRVSVYDADTDVNSQPLLLWGSNNTVEDCIVGGTGRFMVDVYGGGGVTANGNTVRRCFVKWSGWDGKNFCGVTWPNGFMLGAYNSSGGTFENNVIYGRGVMGLIVQANTSTASAGNNHVLGNLTLLQGKDADGSIWHYGSPTWPAMTRPGPTDDPYDDTNCDDSVTSWSWAGQRVGIKFFGQGTLADNVFRDNLSADNAALGFHYANPGGGRYSGNVLDHLTIYGNGSNAPSADGGTGAQAVFPPGVACTNCRIGSAVTGDGSGARLTYRYVDRQLTNQPLLPWPMESRALAEMGVSVDAIIERYAGR